ncbi:WG repeat-containing protein [Hymenobacter algoricola]|uniref:WG repeat-containing protein n=1 Tax=Hymenobacter algoricola TaxID=486267 RepID=A0ABP7MPU7_9BACT
MKLPFLAALLLAVTAAFAQQPPDEVWTQFTKGRQGKARHGYQDADGHIRVPAKFGGFTRAQNFRHIIAVSEATIRTSYYLLKNGRQVGRDSVYMFDFTFDCESEGKIRFKSQKHNRVGFFDSQGRVVIPAIYNAATPFHNGLAFGLIGARAECMSGEADTMRCEHPGWVGGRTVLLNERNEIVVDSLPGHKWAGLNPYSLQVNTPTPDTATSLTFRAVNGDRYSFVDYEKEFTQWLYTVFVPAVRTGEANKVAPLCFTELAASARPFNGWPHFERAEFVNKFYEPVLRPKLGALHRGAKNVVVFPESLNSLIFTSPDFQPFRTDCSEHFQEKYPAFVVVVTYQPSPGKPEDDYQNHFGFIRTENGYRLFQVSL